MANITGIQWTLANPNSLGPEPIQISEIFGLVKATAAMCVIVTAPYLHSVLGTLESLPLLHVHKSHNTLSFSTLLIAKHDLYTQILIIDQLVLDFGFARFRINAIRISEGPL